eukprot:COSAG02_NODE_2383_length_8991_cov_40.938934_8_plen_158_part_00
MYSQMTGVLVAHCTSLFRLAAPPGARPRPPNNPPLCDTLAPRWACLPCPAVGLSKTSPPRGKGVTSQSGVHGDAWALSGMTSMTKIHLQSTLAYGNAAALRSMIPSLSQVWVSWCTDFACPDGTTRVSNAEDMVGTDVCACCSGSAMVRDPETGVCA